MRKISIALVSLAAAAAQANPTFLQKKVAERQDAPRERVNARLETRIDNRLDTRIRDAATGNVLQKQTQDAASDRTHTGAGDKDGARPQ